MILNKPSAHWSQGSNSVVDGLWPKQNIRQGWISPAQFFVGVDSEL